MTLGFEALADKNMGLFAITEAAAIKLNMRSVCVCMCWGPTLSVVLCVHSSQTHFSRSLLSR